MIEENLKKTHRSHKYERISFRKLRWLRIWGMLGYGCLWFMNIKLYHVDMPGWRIFESECLNGACEGLWYIDPWEWLPVDWKTSWDFSSTKKNWGNPGSSTPKLRLLFFFWRGGGECTTHQFFRSIQLAHLNLHLLFLMQIVTASPTILEPKHLDISRNIINRVQQSTSLLTDLFALRFQWLVVFLSSAFVQMQIKN